MTLGSLVIDCHGPPQLGMGIPGMRVLEARWVRIWWWQTETNTEAVWIWVYSAALKQGILYIKKPNITSLRNYIQWNNHKYQQKSFGTVKHKNHPSITTLKLCIQWITNRTGNIIINHQNITILKGCIQWGSHPRLVAYFQEQVNKSLMVSALNCWTNSPAPWSIII